MKKNILKALFRYKSAMLVFILVGFLAGYFVTSFIFNNYFSYYEFNIETNLATNLVFNEDYFEKRINSIIKANEKLTQYNNEVKKYNELVVLYNSKPENESNKKTELKTVSNTPIYYWKFDDIVNSYKDIGKNIIVDSIDNTNYRIRIQNVKFTTSFISSSQKTNEGINKCKKSITTILTSKGIEVAAITIDDDVILGSENTFELLKNGFSYSLAPYYDVKITSDFNITNYHNPYGYGGLAAFAMFLFSIAFFFIIIKAKNEDYLVDIVDNEKIYSTPFHKSYWKNSLKPFKNIKDMVVLAMLLALVCVFKLIKIPSGFGALGIGFTYLILAVIGMIYGPIVGLFTGAFSDIMGFVIAPTGGMFFIGYTLDAVVSCFLYGIFFYKTKLTYTKCLMVRTIINLVVNVVFGSLWYMIVFVGDFTYEGYMTYMTFISLPKNLIYLLPQSIVLFLVLKIMTKPLAMFGLIDTKVKENVTLF